VTCTVPGDVPLDMVTAWIAESYRLVAPKRLSRQLDARAHDGRPPERLR
jgi:predicted DNA-binding protein (MmcQ/YjbR family)